MQENKKPNILYSCYSQKNSEGEQFIAQHNFGYMISGSSEHFIGGEQFVFKPGDFRFFKRNQLTRWTKFPPPGGEYRSISISIDQDTLHSISEEYNLKATGPDNGRGAMLLEPNNLLKNYIDSLGPYLDGNNEFNKGLTNLKVKEAVMVLLETNPGLKNVLFDFSEPGKLDLEAYMNEHYKFNVDINRFAYLTGRSLAAFKRDFQKIFNTSPNRWLQQKRLADAHYLIREKGWKSSDVYLEVGFKDLSHFSFAFKKAYGVAPSRIGAIA
ncbi:helix-turn-helix domain-containing protein [Pedobacter ghigonis]|uniref:helix-turn-helix domain-containing protein n=1 Tax=Pedobacter ghigonis TaxID=2730403 RepID=UPI00158AB44E|nr:AraC family transcriptional regulator [Pedobacter ghigonis]